MAKKRLKHAEVLLDFNNPLADSLGADRDANNNSNTKSGQADPDIAHLSSPLPQIGTTGANNDPLSMVTPAKAFELNGKPPTKSSSTSKMKMRRAQILTELEDQASAEHDTTLACGPTTEISAAPGSQAAKSATFGANLTGLVTNDARPAGKTDVHVLTNVTDFLLENNANCRPTWAEVSHQITRLPTLDGEDKYVWSESMSAEYHQPPRGFNMPYLRWSLRRIVESLWFRLLTLALIVADIVIVVVDIVQQSQVGGVHRRSISEMQSLDLALTCYFVLEVSARIFALTCPVFFSIWYNVVDMAVVFVSMIASLYSVASNATWAAHFNIVAVIRLVRIVRLVRLYTEKQLVERSARQMVSQTKRRYKSGQFDIDLTYITPRVIATSFPSSGITSLYRNHIQAIADFLDSSHGNAYKVYNLCSEKSYSYDHFHGRVERYLIDDHCVPTLSEMARFTASVKSWLSINSDNVVVIHCKGGKGRTGTMVCAWLIEAGLFSDASASLTYFGHRRTEAGAASDLKRFQGVETPSQMRYVAYYEAMKRNSNSQPPSMVPQLKVIEITIHSLRSVGRGDGTDFSVTITSSTSNASVIHFDNSGECSAEYDSKTDTLCIKPETAITVHGDVSMVFQTTASRWHVPRGYLGCPFYFSFHTSFVGSKLSLVRNEIDNLHKSKTWHVFRDTFQIDIRFAPV